ncbi:glutamate decarboxylase [Tanacetum coccineum]
MSISHRFNVITNSPSSSQVMNVGTSHGCYYVIFWVDNGVRRNENGDPGDLELGDVVPVIHGTLSLEMILNCLTKHDCTFVPCSYWRTRYCWDCGIIRGLAFKRKWQAKGKSLGKTYDGPNIVSGSIVQDCWEKFSRYFDVHLKEVKLKEGYYVMDPIKAIEMVDENIKIHLKKNLLDRISSISIGLSNVQPSESPCLPVLFIRTSQSRQHDKSESVSYCLTD